MSAAAAAVALQAPSFVPDSLVGVFDFVVGLVIALAILLIGVVVGGKAQSLLAKLGRRVELDEKVAETPLGALFADDSDGASQALGTIVKYYIILVAVIIALEYLGLTEITSWLDAAAGYVPYFLGGLLILLVGFYVSDYAGEHVRNSETAQTSGFPHVFADVTKAVLYFVVVVIALDTMNVNVGILYTFGETFALAAGIAFALAVGIAFGWGGKDYVAANISEWHDEKSEN